jgi:hypothetical protein
VCLAKRRSTGRTFSRHSSCELVSPYGWTPKSLHYDHVTSVVHHQLAGDWSVTQDPTAANASKGFFKRSLDIDTPRAALIPYNCNLHPARRGQGRNGASSSRIDRADVQYDCETASEGCCCIYKAAHCSQYRDQRRAHKRERDVITLLLDHRP